MRRLHHWLERLGYWTGRLGHQIARLRDWLGTIVAVATAGVEHWLGETAAVAGLTALVVVCGGILWRRVSVLMAAPQANNCTKSYAVEERLVNYMAIMAPLAPLVTANTPTNTNATFLATLKKVSAPSSPGTAPSSYSQTFEQDDLVGPVNEIIAAGGSGGWW